MQNLVCAHIPGASEQPAFCRNFLSPMLAACGQSDDIKIITSAGDVHHIENRLADASDVGPLHDEPSDLSLTAVWVPDLACLPGLIAPQDMFAIRNSNQFWRFDGATWANMNVPVPSDQTLSWLDGAVPDNVVAVGFRPNGKGGNEGVIWNYDGQDWIEDTDLPAGTPGLTDVAVNVLFENEIFASDFENGVIVKGPRGVRSKKMVAAEDGKSLVDDSPFFAPLFDIEVATTLGSTGNVDTDSQVRFDLVLTNHGPATATNISFAHHAGRPTLDFVTDTCGMTTTTQGVNITSKLSVPVMEPMEVIPCSVQYTVFGGTGETISSQVSASVRFDINFKNNQARLKLQVQNE